MWLYFSFQLNQESLKSTIEFTFKFKKQNKKQSKLLKIRKKYDIRIYKLYNSNNEKIIFKILKVLTQKIIF